MSKSADVSELVSQENADIKSAGVSELVSQKIKDVSVDTQGDVSRLESHGAYVSRLASLISSASSELEDDCSASELDSHANMIVVGKYCTIFDSTGKTCSVNAFSPSAGTIHEVPIVDAAVAYDCPLNGKTYILLMRNVLSIPEISHNLIPPFILREGGVIVNECPKSQAVHPTDEDHSLFFSDADLRIHLDLNGTFSSFRTRTPSEEELAACDKIFITPDSTSWDPYSTHFSENEAAMLNAEGQLITPSVKQQQLLCDETDYLNLPSVSCVNSTIDQIIDQAMDRDEVLPHPNGEPQVKDQNYSVPSHETNAFAKRLSADALRGKIAAAIGSVTVNDSPCPLFTTTLDDLESVFHSEVSAIELDKVNGVSPDFLSKIWSVSDNQAKEIIKDNTQLNRQPNDGLLSKQFSTNDRMLRYRRINSYFFSDTMFVTASAKSTRGYTMLQLFVSDKGFVAVYPMEKKSDFQDCLQVFCKEIGVPISLVVDPAREQTSKAVKRFCNQVGTTLRILEEHTQWANRAELYIGLLKESIRKDLRRSHCPLVLWDYCAQRRALIHNLTPRNLFQLEKASPYQVQFGVQGDISNLCQFDWYDWCYYREQGKNLFPYQKELLGRVLGPSKNEGNEMAQNVLNFKGNVVPRRSVRRLTQVEVESESEIRKRAQFTENITQRLGDSLSTPPPSVKPESMDPLDFDARESDDEVPIGWVDGDPIDPSDNKPVFEHSLSDTLIGAEVLLPQGENLKSAKVKGRHTNEDGNVVGAFDNNPLLNSLIYDVEFPDGTIREYAANVIAQNMYSSLDESGFSQLILDCIMDHSKDNSAVAKADKYLITKKGNRRLRKTTVGWKILVRWKDGTEQWVPLRLLKDNYPVQIAEYAKTNQIDDEPAFCWWVPYTLRKRDVILSSVKARVRKANVKYGIKVPRSQKEAIAFDEDNGNTFWQDAIDLEMNTILPGFDFPEDGKPPPGFTKSSGHLVFDVKMDFTRKARWVKDGHLSPDPIDSNYAGVVSRESVRIAFTYAALNGLDISAGDIKSAYLQAPTSEKHYVICGSEFPLEYQGRVAVIKRALYGGKSAGADYWKHMRTCMNHLGFEPCKADPDLWMRKAVKPSDGTEYWEYVLLYVDDALCVSHRPKEVLEKEIGKYWIMKPNSVGPPKLYLGNKVSQVKLDNGVLAWSFSSSQYVQSAIANVERHLKNKNESLPKKASAPFSTNYRPEIDVSSTLNPTEAAYYQSLIGILRWIVELGRVDITCEVSMMASMMAMPRIGHLNQLFHMFAYLKQRHNSEMVFDPTLPDIDEDLFPKEDWRHTPYAYAKEGLPPKTPDARGQGFVISTYVDSDHAGDTITRRSRTGFIVYLNSSPIFWFSKKQGGIETSSFGSEFIAMKQCCEYIRGLRYKLRMMGIPVDGPAFIFGDNKSVLVNSSQPDSVLKKKSNSIAYHFVREGSATDEWRVTYIPTTQNVADLLTKPLGGGEKRQRFIRMILHYVF